MSRAPRHRGYVVPAGLDVRVETRQTSSDQARIVARIVPRSGSSGVEVISQREPIPAALDPAPHAGVDSGLNNLALLAEAEAGFVPRLVNRRPVTSSKQCYNKRRAEGQRQWGAASH